METLKAFKAATSDPGKITYPLLSDKDAAVMKAFGILNKSYAPGHRSYGIPYPGSFLISPDGVILAKFFEKRYQNRTGNAKILAAVKALQAAADGSGAAPATP